MSHKYLEEVAEEYMLGVTNPGMCEYCKESVDLIIQTPCTTKYSWDGIGEDPNRDPLLCIYCANEYVMYWEERWAEYYSSIL
jgi:hypothetical protein